MFRSAMLSGCFGIIRPKRDVMPLSNVSQPFVGQISSVKDNLSQDGLFIEHSILTYQ